MPILGRLFELYRREGIEICSGLPPPHFKDLAGTNFTWFLKDGQNLTLGLGIAPQEIYFLETLFAAYQPHRVVVVGNSQGWSTLAIALLLPEAKVVAIDAGFDGLSGLDLTNRIADKERLNVRAIKGVSPQDVGGIIDVELGGCVDFAFIDGHHTNDQIVLDFTAIQSKAEADSIYLFHDVHSFDLYAGLAEIERLTGWTARPLRATPSGMALICDWKRHPEIAVAVAPFAPSLTAQSVVEREAQQFEPPAIWKLRRFLGAGSRFRIKNIKNASRPT